MVTRSERPTSGGPGITISEHPILSIVLPTYNRLSTLRRCIQQIRTNVSIDHELIIVDGGSSDGTPQFLARHTDLRIIHEPGRQGAAAARRRGFLAARGPYVMWLDDRAYPLPGSVEAALDVFQQSPGLGMIGFYDNRDETPPVRRTVRRDGIEYRIYDVRGRLYAHYGLMPRNVMLAIASADPPRNAPNYHAHPSSRVQLELHLPVVGCPQAVVHHQPAAQPRTPGPHPRPSLDFLQSATDATSTHRAQPLLPLPDGHTRERLQTACITPRS